MAQGFRGERAVKGNRDVGESAGVENYMKLADGKFNNYHYLGVNS